MTAESPFSSLCMQVALDAGHLLCRDAIWHENACNWVGANVLPSGGRYQAGRTSCGASLYSGLAGIALFLGHLSAEPDEPVLEETFRGTVSALLALESRGTGSRYAYYAGDLGVADVLLTLGALRKEASWQEAGMRILHRICAEAPAPGETDIINGVAGSIPALLRLGRTTNTPLFTETAIRCGERLLQEAIRTDQSWTWITLSGSPGLTGYSHGNAGIVVALLELHAATGDPQWLQAAMMGAQYERGLFDPARQNWPDLRQMGQPPASQPVYAEAWCHGAPGIALARVRAWQLTGDNSFLQEAATALQTTRQGLYRAHANYSLCHGIAGNADILFTAGQLLNDSGLMQLAREAGQTGAEQFFRQRILWPSGVTDPNGGNAQFRNPSLMLGLAGTGYFYLRLARPETVPSVLLVQ